MSISAFVKFQLLTVIFLTSAGIATGQTYNFSHYGIGDGLIQSQVTNFSEDTAHRLWMSTLGGASRFDGKEYYNVSKEKGLVNNFVYCTHADKSGRVWFGTLDGICFLQNDTYCYFKNPPGIQRAFITSIAEDHKGDIWIIINNHLFKINGATIKPVKISDDVKDPISCVAANSRGKLFVSVYQKGIYALQGDSWVNMIPVDTVTKTAFVQKIVFDQKNTSTVFLLTRTDIYRSNGIGLQRYEKEKLGNIPRPLLSLGTDENNNLWIGTNNGAFEFDEHQLIHFTAENGFSDFPVFDIYKDITNNLWFGTGGDGFYKYNGADYKTYSHTTENKTIKVIVGIAEDKKHDILVGTDNDGILQYKNDRLMPFWSATNHAARSILSMYTDKNNTIWVGTAFGGIWKYDGARFRIVAGTGNQAINAIVSEPSGRLWFGTPTGCYSIDSGMVRKLKEPNSFVSSLLMTGKDSLFIGTQHGVYLAVNGQIVRGFTFPELDSSSVYCILKNKNDLLFGTDDRGLFIWDNKSRQVENFDTKDGLKSSCIYSMATDGKGMIWLGTGLGVDRMFDRPGLHYQVIRNSSSKNEVIETNQNSACVIGDKVYFGTTKGLVIYNSEVKPASPLPPFILFTEVKVHTTQGERLSLNDSLARNPGIFNYDQNHLTISFLGVDLKNPDGVYYQYRLAGAGLPFCFPVKSNTVDYPALPPGKYVFEVRAINAGGFPSIHAAMYRFEISQPFYQTILFRLLVFLLIAGSFFMVQALFRRNADRRKAALELMKQQEKTKLREQTSEDFHDDLGNKLTRITILSDILHAKLDKGEKDLAGIVDQIKENAESLFHGTKEILWALDPKSDNLYELLNHIKYFAHELFLETQVTFQAEEFNPDIKAITLPMEYSRNISLIFKELLHNILKHADAKNVVLSLHLISSSKFSLQLYDDGKGFHAGKIKEGHGLKNIRSRAERINGELFITSNVGAGTNFVLTLGVMQ